MKYNQSVTELAFYLLGSPRIERNGASVDVDTRKAIALLAYLAVTGQPHQRDALAGLLWPDYDQTSARAALRRTLSALNKALEDVGIQATRESLSFDRSSGMVVDLFEFRSLLEQARRHHQPGQALCDDCLDALTRAERIAAGGFMEGFNLRDSQPFDEWQFFQNEAVQRDLAAVLEALARGSQARGRLDAAIQYARRWLAQDALLEEPHRLLMLLYSAAGQRNAALRQYRECVRVLEQELGVSPLEETNRIYQEILENRVTTQPAAGNLAMPQPPAQAEARGFSLPALIGRKNEWFALETALVRAQQKSQVVVLSGEAGIGKTRLAEEFLGMLAGQGRPTLHARCFAGQENLAYGPLLEALTAAISREAMRARLAAVPPYWLAEAAQLFPSLAGSLPPAMPGGTHPGPGAQTRLFEGICQVFQALLAGERPGALFLDDLQWADDATLGLLDFLLVHPFQPGFLILLSWREEGSQSVERLAKTLLQLSREGRAARLTLARFTAAEISELVKASGLPPGHAHRLEDHLYQESEGLPFIAVEYLKALSAAPLADAAWELPASVRGLLHARLESAGEAALQLLSAGAVLGHSFDFDLLRECSGRSELEVIEGIERLLALGLLRESIAGPGRLQYDFNHDKLRALAYEETSLARRRLLHRRTAEILARQNNPAALGLVAAHFENAGLPSLAADFHRRAGEFAARVYANRDALAHFRAALACGYPEPAGLHQAIGDLQVLLGEYRAAIISYETAASLSSPENLHLLEYKLGQVSGRSGEWEQARGHLQAALALLPEEAAPALRAGLFSEMSLNAFQRGRPGEAMQLAEEARLLAQESGDRHALAQALNLLGILSRESGDLPTAQKHLALSLEIARELAHPGMQAAALNNLALVFRDAEDYTQAIAHTSQALELCRMLGDRHREAALHNNLADLFHATGQEDAAMQELKQAVVLFAEVGLEAGSAQPEIWKLMEW